MDDLDIIASLIPCNGYKGKNAETAFAQRHNAARYYGPADSPSITELVYDSRESTPAPLSPSMRKPDCTGRLVLRFSDCLINVADGIMFGKSEKSSDILMQCPGVLGVSRRHFAIVVKEDGAWYLEDFFSTFGTAVSYDGKAARHKRTHERWIIAHPPKTPKQWDELIVYAGDVAFRIDFPNQEAGRPIYQANLEAFIRKCRTALPAVGVLGLESQHTTVAPSQIASPDRSRQPIYIDYEEVGRGAFAAVLKVMSSRDGLFYAMKKFSRPTDGSNKNERKRRRDADAWLENKRKEADTMRKSAHPSIMPLIDIIEEPDAFSIVMPYYQSGGLQDYCPDDETYAYGSIFLQILVALSWLHSCGVVHRDIKPENFLIEDETPLKIVVADFGLSNMSMDQVFTTFCGTLLYCAPEVFPGNCDGYGPKADIWSLGVMMLNLIFGLPDSPVLPPSHNNDDLRKWAGEWSERLCRQLHNLADGNTLLTDILLDMIKIDPEERFTADDCLQSGLENGLFRRNLYDQIVLQNDTNLNTTANVSWQLKSVQDLDGLKTPTMQSPQLVETAAIGDQTGKYFLNERLWGCIDEHQGTSSDRVAPEEASPSRSTSGPPKRRQKINDASNQLQMVEDSKFHGQRCAKIGSSIGSLLNPKRGLEQEQNTNNQPESPAVCKAEEVVADNEVWGSVEWRVFEMLA